MDSVPKPRKPGSGVPVTREVIEHVLTLLAEGISQREAAIKSGASRGTTQQIAKGKIRPEDRMLAKDFHAAKPSRRSRVRCSTCGGSVYPPCRACGLRREMGLC